ncbi:MAG: hypothetical protein E2O84_03955 [Bacteroidetes bacterium]|nr:MAG: hypothetical protein E2O84_03955 [Bacteroidota bacterium]
MAESLAWCNRNLLSESDSGVDRNPIPRIIRMDCKSGIMIKGVRSGGHRIYACWSSNRIARGLGFLVAVILGICPISSQAQDTAGNRVDDWLLNRIFIRWEGEAYQPLADSITARLTPVSQAGISGTVVNYFRSEGYLTAAFDSVKIREPASDDANYFFSAGPRTYFDKIMLSGIELFTGTESVDILRLKSGDPFRTASIEEGIARLLDAYASRSYHLATVSINSIAVSAGSKERKNSRAQMNIAITVNEGHVVPLSELHLPGSRRTKVEFVAAELGLRLGRPLLDPDPDHIRARLIETGLFNSVGIVAFEIAADSTLHLSIPVEEAAPGTFDFVLGFLPAENASSSGQLIGSGNLDLVNPFGYGRRFAISLDRLPGQVSSANVQFGDPRIFGLPIRMDLGFTGYQRDSTYSQQLLQAEAAYRLDAGFDVGARFSRETTKPGQAGNELVGSVQRIPDGKRTFVGLAVYVNSLDNPRNPRRGFTADMLAESGSKSETRTQVLAGNDTTTVVATFRQERLQMSVRAFMPVFDQHTILVGVDFRLLRSPSLVESDLFRMGGAKTLRGYDEDRFFTDNAVRFLYEYRILVGPTSYAFAFLDVAYIHLPGSGGAESTADWYPGYGIGMQWNTAAGLLKVSYAINNEDGPARGRIHMGLAFGL